MGLILGVVLGLELTKYCVALNKPSRASGKVTQPIDITIQVPFAFQTVQIAVAPALTAHEELMQTAGIAPSDWGYADYIISHESSWNDDATEPTTGAHGLPQALPYSKTNCGWTDAICQLTWANIYAQERYNGWDNAYYHWLAHHDW